MKDQSSSDNWRLQEGEQPDDRWKLQESEQRLADQWSLQNTPEDFGQEWQPVEYVKPRRPVVAWVLPTIITIALLAVIGYTAMTMLPDRLGTNEEPTGVAPSVTTPVSEEPTSEAATATPEQAVAQAPAPEAVSTEAVSPTPTSIPLVPQQFGTVTSTYGVNARLAPNTDAGIIRTLQQNETLFVFEVQGEWVELFVNDTPLAEGQPLSGTIGYAAAEFVQIDTREVSQALVNQVLEYVGRAPTPEPLPTEAPAETPAPEAGGELVLPTVTPTAGVGEPGVTEIVTDTVTDTTPASITVTISAVNGVNVRREPVVAEGNEIRLLEFNTVLPAVARNEESSWIQVLLPDGLTGWISAEFVEVSGAVADLPLPGATGSEAPAAPEVDSGEVITSGIAVAAPYTNVVPGGNAPAIIVTVPEGVNARSAPDIEAEMVVLVPSGAVLVAEARSPDSQWVQVRLPTGQLAWIFRDTVTATPAVGALPAVEVETPTPTPAPTATPAAATPEAPATVATASVRQLFLSIYGAPSSTGEPIGQAPRGRVLDVTGRNTAGDWIQVVDDAGVLGWVAAGGVTVSVDIATLPDVE